MEIVVIWTWIWFWGFPKSFGKHLGVIRRAMDDKEGEK
jgi:hypothetical protein